MTISAVLARPYAPQREVIRNDIFIHPKTRMAIQRGLRDSREGRVRPWSEVKQDFGL